MAISNEIPDPLTPSLVECLLPVELVLSLSDEAGLPLSEKSKMSPFMRQFIAEERLS